MEILFTEIVKIGVGPWFWVCVVAALIFGIIGIISSEYATSTITPICCAIAAIICLIGVFFFGGTQYGAKEETHHYITIDDSISFSEINEKYEIIEQKDKIYIVKEKE